MTHDIKCYAEDGCIYPDSPEQHWDTMCDKCEHNHCKCELCQKKREEV